MIIARPGYEIITDISMYATEELMDIELAARNCYKSEGLIKDQGESAKDLIKRLIENGHDAMLEFKDIEVRFICDRGVSHELVRHRLASFSQESTRYCNYSKDRFGNQITVIEPSYLKPGTNAYAAWFLACGHAEKAYMKMLEDHCSAQEARCVLPTCLKTELFMKANYREWRHILKERTSAHAHPQMRELMLPLLVELYNRIPVIFDDIYALRFGKEDERTYQINMDQVLNKKALEEALCQIDVKEDS